MAMMSNYINIRYEILNDNNVSLKDRYILLAIESAFDNYWEYNDMVSSCSYDGQNFATFSDVFSDIKKRLNVFSDEDFNKILLDLKRKKLINFTNTFLEGIVLFEIPIFNCYYEKTDYHSIWKENKEKEKKEREVEKLRKLEKKQKQNSN